MSDTVPQSRFRIVIEPQGWTFDVPGSMPLLVAAGLAGMQLPASCRNGTCRACMCRMIKGSVQYKIAWPGLSAEEKKEGFILPCVANATSDAVIEAPQAKMFAR